MVAGNWPRCYVDGGPPFASHPRCRTTANCSRGLFAPRPLSGTTIEGRRTGLPKEPDTALLHIDGGEHEKWASCRLDQEIERASRERKRERETVLHLSILSCCRSPLTFTLAVHLGDSKGGENWLESDSSASFSSPFLSLAEEKAGDGDGGVGRVTVVNKECNERSLTAPAPWEGATGGELSLAEILLFGVGREKREDPCPFFDCNVDPFVYRDSLVSVFLSLTRGGRGAR